ncbi:MAG: pyruvate radical-activating enzyme [Parachlamydiales bacterium]|nr:pyruvate radical-activating enzyme [Parachlamydiales bacterium]
MKIGGIAPFTTIDFPDALAAVLFCQGCPWRCGYCHNPHLQSCSAKAAYDWPRILNFLKMRQGFLDAVVFSGGEPTQQPDLISAIQDVRKMGFKIGLHTAGMHPDPLQTVLPYVDWVGMDIKAPFDDYEKITRIPKSGLTAKMSASHILASGVRYEFRTTVHPRLLTIDDLKRLAEDLIALGAHHYALQQFRTQGCGNESLTTVYQNVWDDALMEHMKKSFQTFLIRE